jgi:hypothetical protein
MDFLTKRIDLSPEEGYSDFRRQSHNLIGQPIKRMSKLTERLMQSIDYDAVAARRVENYNYLHKYLAGSNQLHPTLADNAVPMIYPYQVSKEGLRDYLIQNKVFVAKYWPNVQEYSSKESIDFLLATKLVPLPIDQRYQIEEMNQIIKCIENEYQG